MAAYAVIIPVNSRTEASFTREELETAARVAFYTSPPAEYPINTAPAELRLDWHEEFLAGGDKIIRVIGDVDPGPDAPLTDESWWTG